MFPFVRYKILLSFSITLFCFPIFIVVVVVVVFFGKREAEGEGRGAELVRLGRGSKNTSKKYGRN